MIFLYGKRPLKMDDLGVKTPIFGAVFSPKHDEILRLEVLAEKMGMPLRKLRTKVQHFCWVKRLGLVGEDVFHPKNQGRPVRVWGVG